MDKTERGVIQMRYVVKFHQTSGEWLVFDMGDDLELIGMFRSKDEATAAAKRLEERAQRRQRWAREPALHAA
jgi:hypothetical protein